MLDAWETLGLSLVRLGREQEALAALDAAVRLDPGRASAQLALARLHAYAGRPREAEVHAAAAALKDPAAGHELLAELLLSQSKPASAADHARRSVAADPKRVMSHVVLAVVARREGRLEDALASYQRAADAQRLQRGLVVRDLHAGMADCLARLGREAEAEREFQAEIQAIPHSREGRVGLAMLYRSQARDAEARQVLEGVVTTNRAAGAEEYWAVVRTFATLGDDEKRREWSARARTRFPRDPRFR
jgi:Tfp pilus assembly protein PilF